MSIPVWKIPTRFMREYNALDLYHENLYFEIRKWLSYSPSVTFKMKSFFSTEKYRIIVKL